MSRAVVTAILLEELRREGAEIRLPKDALITPAARDWMKEHPVPITWLEPQSNGRGGKLAVVMDTSLQEMRAVRTMLDRWLGLVEVIELPPGLAGVVAATRRICGMVVRGEVARGMIFAQDAAVPLLLANKHNNIRAALGLTLPMVEDAVRKLAVNLLVVEYPVMSTFSVKQMIERMLFGPTQPVAEVAEMIQKIEQGAGRADW